VAVKGLSVPVEVYELVGAGPVRTRLASTKEVGLAVRIGIHTGLVVVGEMGGAADRKTWR
jgi:class 3 adenylate cyclase